MTLLLVAFFLFFLLIILSVLLLVYERRQGSGRKINRRLAAYSVEMGLNPEQLPLVLRDERLSDISFFNRFLSRLDFTRKLKQWLEQSDTHITVGTLVLVIALLTALGLLFTRGSSNFILRFFVVFGLGLIPILIILYRRGRRLRAFVRAFPDALDMMTSSLRAGHALNKSIQMVGLEAPDPIGVEFRKTFEETNLGLPMRESLVNLTQRVNSIDLKLFVTAVLLQRETGGNLAEILEKISYTIRERFKLMGQIRTYTAQGRMTMWVLGSMPVVFALVINAINPDYFAPLLESPTGRKLLLTGAVMQIFGFLVIRRIIRIKFQ
ncbi:MAG: Bacterial type II secretion system protein F domain protein [bacterium ADurb.Bin478]|nr:MAG: Bacterial type II secretion system protein F domain protein [bacterium ADurb.Bin478]